MNISFNFYNKKNLPVILQNERNECGHACIAMISNYWGHRLDLFDLRQFSSTSSKGITLLEINKILDKLGFVTRALQIPLEELHLLKTPAILHWNMNHFVVLKKVKKNGVVIHDPALGLRFCSIDELNKTFTGIALEIDKSASFQAINAGKGLNLLAILKTFQNINYFIVLLLILSVIIEIFNLLNPLFIQYVTDNVIGFSERSNLFIIAFAFLILIFLQIVAEYTRGNFIIYITNHLTEQFSSNVVRHILKLPLDFFEKRHKGDLQSKFQSIDQIQKKITTDFVNTILDGIMLIINLMVMLVYSQLMTLIVIIAVFITIILRYVSYHFFKKQNEISIYKHAKAATVFLETLQAMLPIKTFLKEHLRFNSWRNSYIDALNADIKVARLNIIYQIANQFLTHVEHIVVICLGALLVLDNKISLGMFLAFMAYRQLFINKSNSFIQNIFDYKLISIHLNRLGDILLHPAECISSSTLYKNLGGKIAVCNLSFKYNLNEPYIINNFNITVAAGEKVAIIGPSGCGKSTLLKLMMGVMQPNSGEIFVDDLSLSQFGQENFREQIASVMQDDVLLSGSILQNIAFFAESIDIEYVYEVAKIAQIHDTICSLIMGYETSVGELGSILSGGQKQRILLARALYKKPKILFLDEATSHLDVENEQKLNKSLSLLKITQIIVAHREATIKMANRIISL